ncbi:predicted protein [Postia placenta Mad-698-R]|uniref:Rad60/SUMO-like domain-containing protein n=1 Tax=Postia placenta MAD-698-R-SB12 TaxID=670580 RepID=A0A1X6MU04_9APHY|nr:hypothetical protein POSPLADRAFT_1149988 [Postia placenta MAD-698-R-SB12]EED79426.1 predicted protein [Postia placenta Mad-698-R]OSX59673.1 hypothetical protein POSPLADRAFT_1149988 [Postia placenta MAD-698-R-SB12]
MSTRPRPRPKPRRLTVATAAASSTGPSSIVGTSPPPVSAVVDLTIEDEDALFIRNRNRTAQTWKKLNRATEDSSGDEEGIASPRRRKNQKKGHKEQSLPAWTRGSSAVHDLLSSDEDEEAIRRRIETQTSNAKGVEQLARPFNGNNKRPRSRSRSITPPPALPAHALQHARDAIREIMGIIPRAPSPTYEEEESADVFELDPELARIRAQIRSQSDSFETPASQDTGGPPTVAVKVRWIPHPQNPAARSDVWGFKLNRVICDNLRVSYENKRVFPSATPHSLKIWSEAELEACDVRTYEYLQDSRRQRSLSVQPVDLGDHLRSKARAPSPIPEESDDTGAESASDTFRLTLRSGKTKDIVLTVRPSTACGAIVKAFLKKSGLAEQYPEPTVEKRKGKKGKPAEGPRLMLDGDKLDPASEIGAADLEDGDLVEVVGL